MDKMESALRVYYLFTAICLWAGIWLTGFDVVHWFIYIPATFLFISSITGICPGIIFLKKVFNEDKS